MGYQQNLGQVPTSAEIRGQLKAPTWADLQSQATTYFRADEGLSPPYTLALLTQSVDSRSGPGTAYAEANYYSPGTELAITGQYGNWFQTSNGDYIPVSATADAVAVAKAEAAYKAQAEAARLKAAAKEAARLKAEAAYKAQAEAAAKAAAAKEAAAKAAAAAARTTAAIKSAITKQTPIAIEYVLRTYDYPAAGISTSVVMALVKAVVDHLVNLVISQLEGEAKIGPGRT